jgi:hypothetical protein
VPARVYFLTAIGRSSRVVEPSTYRRSGASRGQLAELTMRVPARALAMRRFWSVGLSL